MAVHFRHPSTEDNLTECVYRITDDGLDDNTRFQLFLHLLRIPTTDNYSIETQKKLVASSYKALPDSLKMRIETAISRATNGRIGSGGKIGPMIAILLSGKAEREMEAIVVSNEYTELQTLALRRRAVMAKLEMLVAKNNQPRSGMFRLLDLYPDRSSTVLANLTKTLANSTAKSEQEAMRVRGRCLKEAAGRQITALIIEEKVQKVCSENGHLREINSELEREKNSLKKERRTAIQIAQEKEAELARCLAERNYYRQQSNWRERRVRHLETTLDKKKTEITRLKRVVIKKEKAIARLEDRSVAQRAAVTRANAKCNNRKNDIQHLNKTQKILQEEIEKRDIAERNLGVTGHLWRATTTAVSNVASTVHSVYDYTVGGATRKLLGYNDGKQRLAITQG